MPFQGRQTNGLHKKSNPLKFTKNTIFTLNLLFSSLVCIKILYKMNKIFLIFSCLMLMNLTLMAQNFKGKYPISKKVSQVDDYFGTQVSDPYRWLEDDNAADTKAWVIEQNKVTQSYLDQIPFRDKIKARLKELWNYEKFSAPFKEGAYTYYFRNDGLQNQSVLYRQLGTGKPEVFIDPNAFSKDGTVSLSGLNFSKDGSLVAYQLSKGGADWTSIMVMRTKDKKLIGSALKDIKFSGVAWKGNDGFYYSTYDKPKEGSMLSGMTDQHKLLYHKLGTAQSSDRLIFGGKDLVRRYISGGLTEDERFLVISTANSTSGNELYIQDLSQKNSKIKPIVTGFDHEHDLVYNVGNTLYILTNKDATNRKLVKATIGNPEPRSWVEVIAEKPFPLRITTGGKKVFAHYIQDAVSKVFRYDQNGKMEEEIQLPGQGSAGGFSGKEKETLLYYSFSSYIDPNVIYSYDIPTGQSKVYKKPNIKMNFDQFESKQVFYTSADGTKIPMIITFKKGINLNGKNPTILYGYGGFNISLTPSFSISNLAFIEQGGVYAVANLRGGGEYGDTWHIAGTKMQKQNVFDDFIAAAEFLISENYTSKDYLACSGGSNGGLLVGAVITQRPDLFKVALPAVGVLDMLRYNKFTAGAGWAYDYGTSSDNAEMFQYLYKYSPVHAARKSQCFPATMVTTGDHDDRVVPAHSFKFAATLQEFQNCLNPVLIRVEVDAGHGAGKPTDKIIQEVTDRFAFVLWNMGAKWN